MKSKRLAHGDRVELNLQHRPGKGTRQGTVITRDQLPREVGCLVGWDDGSEQLCDVRDLRRIK